MRAIWLQWVDSGAQNGWVRNGEWSAAPLKCETLGFFVAEDKQGIVVALNACPDPSSARPFGELITIPKGAIVRRKWVRLPC